MSNYKPPFTISNKMIDAISSISERVGKISSYNNFETKPQLRKNNRIKSIHSSLAIEANSLTLNDVRDVINGRIVLGPQNEIQEVKNAYKAYEEIDKVDPYNSDELRRMHGVMTYLTVEESGEFRSRNEGVFDGDKCIFMAPTPQLVPELVGNLFNWMQTAKEEIHPLILSSVFHYELVFIHPFADGNGRMARLWQTIILSKWKEVFQFLPIESRIKEFQEEYYNAIAKCNASGNSNTFIEFMLEVVDNTLCDVEKQASSPEYQISEYVDKLNRVMDFEVPYTANAILDKLHLKSKETLRKNYIDPALEMGIIVMTEPDKPTSRNQRYIKK